MEENKKKKSLLILGSLSLIIILLGSAYAFFTYFKSHEAFAITSLNVRAEFIEGTNSVTFQNAYPISDSFAISNLDKLTYIDFTVTSEIESESQAVEYEIYLEEDDGNTLSSDFIKVYLTDDTNKIVSKPSIYSSLKNTTYSNSSNGKVIYKDNNTGTFTKNYRLYVWLDDSYTQNEVSQTFSFKVNLYAYNDNPMMFSDTFKEVLLSRPNSYISEDGIYYVSGAKDDDNETTTDDIDFNYVWYSGKLWRITAIYPDGTMKMITEDVITTIEWGEDDSFYINESRTSWVYQWLNEDFLDTLYDYENIIKINSTWNITSENKTISSKPSETKMVAAKVGLLNSYEYYKSFEKIQTHSNGYLNIGYYWRLLNPYPGFTSTWIVDETGGYGGLPITSAIGVRPSINLKYEIKIIGGLGTKDNPYRIKGDKEEAKLNTTLLNTRSSGEYVKFDGELYRIVGIENNTTKINKVDYIRNINNAVITHAFASTTTYGDTTNKQSDTYWDYYLNNTWYNNISSSYKNMLEKGTYYLGKTMDNYKLAICESASDIISTKECTKTNAIYIGYVGLPRYGEMFSSQLGSGSSSSKKIWLITPFSSSSMWNIAEYGGAGTNSNGISNTTGVRPSINLKSEIVITGGTGLKGEPYTISLPPTE